MSTTARPPGRGPRRTATVAATLCLLLLAATGAAYGVLGLSNATDSALRNRTAPSPVSADGTGTPSIPSAIPTRTPGPSKPPVPAQTAPPATLEPVPEPVLEPGDAGRQVRELQSRLTQLAWFGPFTTGAYDPDTRTAVSGFQQKRGFEATGLVDDRTWQRLVQMTRSPTEAELFNRPGPTLYGPADRGPQVRETQARLKQIAWFFGDVSSSYDTPTQAAVSGFQEKRGLPQTGEVDQRTLDVLEAMTTEPTADDLSNRKPKPDRKPEPQPEPEPEPEPVAGAPLDPRCLTGMALCIDKGSQSLRWVVDGTVQVAVDVRFGSAELPTREGEFSIFSKSRDHVSSLYDTSMPFAMFFSGG
ncbi:MAG: peptidoglycan-binding protein, partial [Nocardioidaceae bacterium]|nr:peptidoglycan-binding protein [Nocardioidaceae bacterium]